MGLGQEGVKVLFKEIQRNNQESQRFNLRTYLEEQASFV